MKIQNFGKFSTLIRNPQNMDVTVESNPMATNGRERESVRVRERERVCERE